MLLQNFYCNCVQTSTDDEKKDRSVKREEIM